MSKRIDKYVEILDLGITPGKKTRVLQVLLAQNRKPIGEILWYGGWRKYVFLSYEGNVYYDSDLMHLVAERCDLETKRQYLHADADLPAA